MERQSIHGQWSSRLVFILAATGSAVGLGNIWKFPYITGENGGGAFVLVYLLCIAVVGIPIMMGEIMLGRRGRQSPINTMTALSREEGRSRSWSLIGWGGVLAGFFILSYYSVIAGWALAYVVRAGANAFNGADAAGVEAMFNGLVGDPEAVLAWHTLFMLMTMFVVAKGVKAGLEKAVTYLMPALFILLLVLVGYAVNTGYFAQGLDFLFTPHFEKLLYRCEVVAGLEQCELSGSPVLVALGHAFFTLSLGMGAIMVYGSYMPRQNSIAGSAILIATLDTLVALVAGMAIFPIVFANGLQPAAGPGFDLSDPAHRLRRHAGRPPVRHPVLHPARLRRLEFGHLADRAGGGLAGGEPQHDPHPGLHLDRCHHLGARTRQCLFIQYLVWKGVPALRQDLL